MSKYKGLEGVAILVVEDIEMNQYLAKHIMESWGCHVEVVENGLLAIDKVKEGDFGLVLMDIHMPVMDGLQATRMIRAIEDEYISSVPIVALTANILTGQHNIYLEAGMNDCLAKPFEEDKLFHVVARNHRQSQLINNSHNYSIKTETPAMPETISKLYDLSMVEAISGGDKLFVVKMVQLFIDTVPATVEQMNDALASSQWLTLSKLAHKLKSTIDSMGIIELKQDIRQIEQKAKDEINLDEMPLLVKKVNSVIQQTIEQIKQDFSL